MSSPDNNDIVNLLFVGDKSLIVPPDRSDAAAAFHTQYARQCLPIIYGNDPVVIEPRVAPIARGSWEFMRECMRKGNGTCVDPTGLPAFTWIADPPSRRYNMRQALKATRVAPATEPEFKWNDIKFNRAVLDQAPVDEVDPVRLLAANNVRFETLSKRQLKRQRQKKNRMAKAQ